MITTNKPPNASIPLVPFRLEDEKAHAFTVLFSAKRIANGLEFVFSLKTEVAEDFKKIVIPERQPLGREERRDELWKHTCLEVFIADEEARYFETNLAPSGHWNIYAFDDYRKGMKLEPAARVALMESEQSADKKEWRWRANLKVESSASPLHKVFSTEETASRPLVLGATAVIEYDSGELEYWALRHVDEKPDFHRRESFLFCL